MSELVRVYHVGKSSRAHILAETMLKSRWPVENHMVCEVDNPGLRAVSKSLKVGPCDDPEFVADYAEIIHPEFAIPGPEEPLVTGVVDRLLKMGIPSVGPVQDLAQLEGSKSFTRALFEEFRIPGNPDYRIFDRDEGLRAYLEELGNFVVKPDGLSGGKGVKVSGDHLHSTQEGYDYALELLAAGERVVVEEKLIGEEFTFQSFCDGRAVAHMPPVQDHKRLLDEDRGPNTGGMGSYSCEDHLLPFLTEEHVREAGQINQAVAQALHAKMKQPYKGILYGSFILTSRGLRVIEYNARFGDPEVMNVLAILETDFVDICRAIIDGTLEQVPVNFARRATVCKYVVPAGYPENPVRNAPIELPEVDNCGDLRMYYGAIQSEADGKLLMTGSRAVAFVGIGDTLAEAEDLAERGARAVRGSVFHRKDIGTAALVQRRVDHMRAIADRSRPRVARYA